MFTAPLIPYGCLCSIIGFTVWETGSEKLRKLFKAPGLIIDQVTLTMNQVHLSTVRGTFKALKHPRS